MTMVRRNMLKKLKTALPGITVNITYGAATKAARKRLGVSKTHSTDAWCMGSFHPKHRCEFVLYKKQRRNNRILEKFYDAKYIDIRDGSRKSGCRLSCNRTNRREKRSSEKNERIYRARKVSKGRRSVRTQHYRIQPGDIVRYEGNRYVVKGVQNLCAYVALEGHTPVRTELIQTIRYTGAWKRV